MRRSLKLVSVLVFCLPLTLSFPGCLGPGGCGAANPMNFQVETPTFTPTGGTFDDSVDATISTLTDGATIYYTTDGANPSTFSAVYNGPIQLNQTTTLRALAVKADMIDSEIASAVFTRSEHAQSIDVLTIDLGNGVTMDVVAIPAGMFMMGTDSTDYDWLAPARPVHEVTIAYPFHMGKYEVTQAQYQAVMGTNPSEIQRANLPVESVSWMNAVAFCEELSGRTGLTVRLPSEAEWEYACKAGSGDTRWHFGDDEAQLELYAWYGDPEIKPVGQKLPNAFGLYDMHGNVWEWCQDVWHENYISAPTDGSAWVAGGDPQQRVRRDGAVYSIYPDEFRSALRTWNWDGPEGANKYQGFRVVVITD